MAAVKAINAVAEHKAADATIDELVPALWARLQQRLDAIPGKESLGQHMRPQTEVLEDLVSQVRGLGMRMREFDPDVLERDSRNSMLRYREFDPRLLDEMMHMTRGFRDGGMSLLLLAGFVRDRMPWLAEVLVECHRELKGADSVEANEIAHRLLRIVRYTTRGPIGDRLFGRSKSGQVFLMELPHLIERAVFSAIEFRLAVENENLEAGESKD